MPARSTATFRFLQRIRVRVPLTSRTRTVSALVRKDVLPAGTLAGTTVFPDESRRQIYLTCPSCNLVMQLFTACK